MDRIWEEASSGGGNTPSLLDDKSLSKPLISNLTGGNPFLQLIKPTINVRKGSAILEDDCSNAIESSN